MKRNILLALFSFGAIAALSQQQFSKPSLDTSVLSVSKWPSVSGVEETSLSNDGKYVSYYINNLPGPGGTKSVIQSIAGDWKIEIINKKGRAYFTKNSNKVIYINAGDSLCFTNLRTPIVEYIPDVLTFRPINQDNTEKILYQKKDLNKTLVLLDVQKATHRVFTGVASFYVLADQRNGSGSSKGFVISRMISDGQSKKYTASWVDIISGKETTFWEGSELQSIIFDDSGNRIAFIATSLQQNERSVWLYKSGEQSAILVADNNSTGIDNGFTINGLERFSPDGSQLFFKVKEPAFPIAGPDAVKVDVWSYTDVLPQSLQLTNLSRGPGSFLSVLNLDNHSILRIQCENEEITLFNGGPKSIAFVQDSRQLRSWIRDSEQSGYFIDTKTGKKKLVDYKLLPQNKEISISPNGQNIIMSDRSWENFYCYEFSTGKIINLTAGLAIPGGFDGMDKGLPEGQTKYRKLEIAGWLEGSGDLLVYDQYDLWRLDVTGKRKGICLTNQYGRRHKISFRLLDKFKGGRIPVRSRLLLSAFKNLTKENGFYEGNKEKAADPEYLYMSPSYFYSPSIRAGNQPVKALDEEAWVVCKERSDKSPNLFYTSDFIHFTQLSNIYPEEKYNWLTSELVNFNTLNGTKTQGVLYKPENFNPKKKYPVIIHYYEEMSRDLHKYELPGPTYDFINIPWFVSHGYLVLTPDIKYEWGHPGQSACNSVIAGAKYLSGFSWVDAKHIGLQGHSFGGFETDYIVAHSGNLFAAAMSSSGMSDFIADYGRITLGGLQFFLGSAETGQSRIGYTLWERPDLYAENSPVLRANDIETPLLMMNNKLDPVVNFENGVELFLALRRLGKKAWMLQYDGEGHSAGISKKEVIQHTLRLTQFFDHYLKGAPAPKWMVEGVSAKRKGIDDGLELEAAGVIPGPGLLTLKEKKKVEAVKHRKTITTKL